MNEGDLVTVFSQWGEIVDCRIARDKKTGKNRGFAFIAYEDQRSTILAVDNFNGIELCGRQICVDHIKKYKIPKDYLDEENDDKKRKKKRTEDDSDQSQLEQSNSEDEDFGEDPISKKLYKPSGPDGMSWGDFRQINPNDLELLEEMQ